MKALLVEQEKAKLLRIKGYSLKEIANLLNVAESSASAWVRDVPLSKIAKNRLLKKIKLGQFVAAENKKARTRALELEYFNNAKEFVEGVEINESYAKLLCAAIYWCEGAKNNRRGGVEFMNSDPQLIKTFLHLFKTSFDVDVNRFRLLVHLHSHHNIGTEIDFWSKITKISKEQFQKPYIKQNGGKRIRDNYHGCLSLRYYDTKIFRQLLAMSKALLGKLGA